MAGTVAFEIEPCCEERSGFLRVLQRRQSCSHRSVILHRVLTELLGRAQSRNGTLNYTHRRAETIRAEPITHRRPSMRSAASNGSANRSRPGETDHDVTC